MNITIEWNKYFDKIYCIHYLNNVDRLPIIKQELNRVDILNNPVFDFYYDYDSPFFKHIQNNLKINNTFPSGVGDRLCEFKCALSHYRILKIASGLKLNRILILEDDVSFLIDKKLIKAILDVMPTSNLILFDKFCYNPQQYINFILNKNNYINQLYKQFNSDIRFGSGACYSVDKIAINTLIKQYESEFIAADNIYNLNTPEIQNLDKAVSIVNICKQTEMNNRNCKLFDIQLAYRFCNVNADLYQKIK